MAVTPHLFEEPYDERPPPPEFCVDFDVDGAALSYGRNEVAVMADQPVRVLSIELAVRNK